MYTRMMLNSDKVSRTFHAVLDSWKLHLYQSSRPYWFYFKHKTSENIDHHTEPHNTLGHHLAQPQK